MKKHKLKGDMNYGILKQSWICSLQLRKVCRNTGKEWRKSCIILQVCFW